MGKDTKIEWSTHTFNPWWSCTKVSEACCDCYAWRDSIRWGWDIWGPGKGRRTFGEAKWREPVKWNKKAEEEGTRHRVFCCSMGDVFEDHADLASERGKLWPLIEKTTSLDWLLLTKRPENMARMAPWTRWPANAWAMTTAETQARLDELWPHLVRVPARVLGLSIEPMLSEIDPRGVFGSKPAGTELWVIAGGESGPSPRPTPVAWLLNLRDQCVSAGVPFFFKQWGVLPASVSPTGKRLGKAKAGRKLDGRTWDGFPGSPGAPIP